MTGETNCGSCGQKIEFEVEDFSPGQETNCPTCGAVFIPNPLPTPPRVLTMAAATAPETAPPFTTTPVQPSARAPVNRHGFLFYAFAVAVGIVLVPLIILGVLFLLAMLGIFTSEFENARQNALLRNPGNTNAPALSASGQNTWHLSTNTSLIDDSTGYALSKTAEDRVRLGFSNEKPTLIIRYREGKLDVYVTFDYPVAISPLDVTHRIGQDTATTYEWNSSTDGEAIFFPGYTDVFVKELIKSNRLVIRLTPMNESAVTCTFDLKGLAQAIQPIERQIGL